MNAEEDLRRGGTVMPKRLITTTLTVKRSYTVNDVDYDDWAQAKGEDQVTEETIRQAEIASVKADPLMFVDYAYLESDTLTVDVEVGQPHE